MYWKALNMSEKRLLSPFSAIVKMFLFSCFVLKSSASVLLSLMGGRTGFGRATGTAGGTSLKTLFPPVAKKSSTAFFGGLPPMGVGCGGRAAAMTSRRNWA